jgi:arylsulfatase A-like enzyme
MILTSDHGNGLTGKGAAYDGGVRVPLVMRWLRHADRVGSSDLLISHVDLLPTLGMLVGATPLP